MQRTMAERLDSWIDGLVNARMDCKPIPIRTLIEVSALVDQMARTSRGDGFFVVEFTDGSLIIYDDDEVR